MVWTGLSLEQVTILTCLRSEEATAEMAGRPGFMESHVFVTLDFSKPIYKRANLSEVRERQGDNFYWAGSSMAQDLISIACEHITQRPR